MAGILSFLPEFPQGSLAHPLGWLHWLKTVASFVLFCFFLNSLEHGSGVLDSPEILLQRGRGNNISVCVIKARGEVPAAKHTFYKFAAGLVKVTTSHEV